MHFTQISTLLAFVAISAVTSNAAAVIPAAGTVVAVTPSDAKVAGDFAAAAITVGLVCTDANLSGSCGTIQVDGIPSSCFNFIGGFDNSISSIRVNAGFDCQFFQPSNCGAGSISVIQTTASNLGGTTFNDAISSVKCFG
ncbi:hypothetical protein C8R43DRAFT_1119104 [Mycena crocata]|nr:hypothetical protein C8R43DRAFT_1119104 [Mycena crocata]